MKGKSLTLIGTAITLAFTSNVAMAESSTSPFTESTNSSISSPTEIKMSLEGMKILCEHFPLNSRCPGGTPINANAPTVPSAVETTPTENKSNSDTNIVPEKSSTPGADNSNQLAPAPEQPSTPGADNSNQVAPAPEKSSIPGADNSNQVAPAPEQPSTPGADNSSQVAPAPEQPATPESTNSGSTSDQKEGSLNQAPTTTIVPPTPAPATRTP
jgi:hypothetical protein